MLYISSLINTDIDTNICTEDIMLSDIRSRHIMTICVKNIVETINNWLNLPSCHRQPCSYGKCAWSQERVSLLYCSSIY